MVLSWVLKRHQSWGKPLACSNVDMRSIAVIIKIGSRVISCFELAPTRKIFPFISLIKGRNTEESLKHKCHIQTSWKQTPDPGEWNVVILWNLPTPCLQMLFIDGFSWKSRRNEIINGVLTYWILVRVFIYARFI